MADYSAPHRADRASGRPGSQAPVSLVGQLHIAESRLRQSTLEVGRIGDGFVKEANDLIMQAIGLELLRRLQAEFNGIVARWNASTVADQQEQELSEVVSQFPQVPRPPPLGPMAPSSIVTIVRIDALNTAVTDMREQMGRLADIAEQYLATEGVARVHVRSDPLRPHTSASSTKTSAATW